MHTGIQKGNKWVTTYELTSVPPLSVVLVFLKSSIIYMYNLNWFELLVSV